MSERIKMRLAEMGTTANAISVAADKPREWLGQIIRKTDVWPTTDNLILICDALGLRLSYLVNGTGARLIDEPDLSEDITLVPRLSWVAAGAFAETETVESGQASGFVQVANLPPGDHIALDVVGDSMDRIAPDGSTIIVNRSEKDLRDKKFYVAATENGDAATFKRFREDWPPRLEPFSNNPEHHAINIAGPVRVVGRVTRVIHDL
ncbi:MAG: hypothetical protein LCH39_01865 [Proteobacteria bacterium]|nr:hypothetical protein [Pseudomonadota bacterium]